jgi:hypothetical protein
MDMKSFNNNFSLRRKRIKLEFSAITKAAGCSLDVSFLSKTPSDMVVIY